MFKKSHPSDTCWCRGSDRGRLGLEDATENVLELLKGKTLAKRPM